MKHENVIITMVFIFMGGLLLFIGCFPEHTKQYSMGKDAMQKEAFSHGFMTKEVDKDDKVIYRWLEPHKYNEQ